MDTKRELTNRGNQVLDGLTNWETTSSDGDRFSQKNRSTKLGKSLRSFEEYLQRKEARVLARAKKYKLNYLDTEVGDLTSDHLINVYDLVAVIELIIEGQYHEKADQNSDGEVNNVDIDILTELIMNL